MLKHFSLAALAVACSWSAQAAAMPRCVVAFGDSTTAPRVVRGKALPVYADLLSADAKPWGVSIVNAGVAANTTQDARARFQRDVLARNPEAVIIQFGINDASLDLWKKPPVTEPRVALKDYTANLTYFVRELQRAGTRVILMTPNPLRWTTQLRSLYGKPPYLPGDPDGLNVLLKGYAEAVREVARQSGAELVDACAAFQSYGSAKKQAVDDLLLDGMHPNAKGHQLIANLLRKQLESGAPQAGAAGRFKRTPSGVEIDARATALPGLPMGPFVRLGDGRILSLTETNSLTSADEGRTWQSKTVFADTNKFRMSNERVILRTREGVLITAFMNLAERKWTWDKKLGDAPGAILPTYAMRSTDDGQTWEPPVKLHDDWTGAEREILQTRSGRIVFTSMQMRHNPGRHTVMTYCSDDQGKIWKASNVIDLGGAGNHDGVTESTIVELKNGRLLKYMRTNWGRFWFADSTDEGLSWQVMGPTDVDASASPALLRRLQSGRIVLLWNRQFPEGKNSFTLSGGDRDWSAAPTSVFRGELSMAFSDDECKTWSKPVIIARQPGPRVRLAYPFLFEAAPGELWITTMQGDVRLKLREGDFVSPNQSTSKPTAAAEPKDRPNILIITAEDLGLQLSCYGDPNVLTPNLDRLAAGGIRFANAYVTYSVCSPSRASLLTGLYPQQHGQIGLATHKYAMFRDWPNLPGLLKQAGYRTGIIGKLHVNPESAFLFDDHAIPAANFNHRFMSEYAAEAKKFITAAPGPFLLYLNFPDTHLPWLKQQDGLPPKPLTAADLKTGLPFLGVDTPRLRALLADYYNCLLRLDAGVGMVLADLEKAGCASNTLVIFLGDHGPQFSRGKTTVFEAGLRVPMLLRWPDRVKPGQVRDELINEIDVLPTALQAAGLAARRDLPGRSLLGLDGAPIPAAWRRYSFAWQTGGATPVWTFPQIAVRDERYKLILNLAAGRENTIVAVYENHLLGVVGGAEPAELAAAPVQVQQAYRLWRHPPGVELYDLQADPHEFNNRAADATLAPVRTRLLAAIKDWQQETRDPFADPAKLAAYLRETDEINRKYQGIAMLYRKDPAFRWAYRDYLASR